VAASLDPESHLSIVQRSIAEREDNLRAIQQ
jgi:hypothetical protein